MDEPRSGRDHWRRPGLTGALLAALATTGSDGRALTVDDLAPLDHFHAGGIGATRALARALSPRPGCRVLDVGGGLGGPARLLAAEHGCEVTVVDVTEDFARAGAALTARLGLQDRVRHVRGDAVALPFLDGRFDAGWTQNSGMNVAAKAALYAELFRVLRPGGRLATQEPAAGEAQPPHFPLMWASHPSGSFLLTPAALRARIRAAGFREVVWDESAAPAAPKDGRRGPPAPTIQQLVMGDRLAAIQAAATRNEAEGRLARIQALFERP